MSALPGWLGRSLDSLKMRNDGPLAIRQVLALDPRRRLTLVRCGDRDVLLLTGGVQDLVVGWLPASEDQEVGS